METNRHCKQTLENGERCKAYSLTGKDFCFSHDPESKEGKAIAVRNGGLVRPIRVETALETVEVRSPKDIVTVLSKTINEVREGKLQPQIANTIGFLSGHLLKAFEVAELNDKVDEVKGVLTGRRPEKTNKRRY